MPGLRCAVAACNNSLIRTKARNEEISYHSFPNDANLRSKWVQACQRTENFNPDTSCICSTHFPKENFELDFRKQLMGTKAKRRLKPNSNYINY